MKGHKQAAFHVRFLNKPVLECVVVSQQYNGMQHTSPNIGIQIHMPYGYTVQDKRQKPEIEPCKTRTVHCNDSEYTQTIFRIVQALAIVNYIYNLQLVPGDINRRAVSPAGLLNQEGVQNAQKAKLSRLEHLPAGSGGGLRGHSTPLPEKFLLYTTGT